MLGVQRSVSRVQYLVKDGWDAFATQVSGAWLFMEDHGWPILFALIALYNFAPRVRNALYQQSAARRFHRGM